MNSDTKRAKWKLNRNIIDGLIFFIILGLLWEYAVKLFGIKSYLLPPLSDIFAAMWTARVQLVEHSLVTLEEVIFGFGTATIAGVAMAVVIYFVPLAKRTIYPLMIALQSIPKIGLAPVIVIWFGYGLSSKVIMAFLFAFFPIIIAVMGGLSGTPQHLEEHFRALKASAWDTFWYLRVPSVLPSFVDGCKVAMPLAVIGAIVGEFVGSNEGLGNLILMATGSSQTALTFGALFAVTILSLSLFYIIELAGKLVWWRAH
ncbi:MAG: ABC transporter permease [Kordiimonadaceae bacterium]|mgnify:CR=1 FL=1|jgi:NitT/TauT family transport system permease protein|nr:ABC transporter permease [Kordiimonadaceae bacterium]MBT6033695.1 ABC transporter permease [Kordiimonadaceae bacterium]